jgi:hypothetical protein
MLMSENKELAMEKIQDLADAASASARHADHELPKPPHRPTMSCKIGNPPASAFLPHSALFS